MGPNANTKNKKTKKQKTKNKKTKASKIPNCNQPINIFFSTKNSNQITPPKQAIETIIFQNQRMPIIKQIRKEKKINGNRIHLQYNRTKGKYIKKY